MRKATFAQLLGLCFLAAGCSALPAATATPDPAVESLVETMLAGTTAVQPTVPAGTAPAPMWIEETIDLYGFSLDLPSGWKIEEINRHPEPLDDPYTPRMGHDCAEYLIVNTDQSAQLFLSPVCGYIDGAGEDCPSDTVQLELRGEKGVVVRSFDAGQGRYIYSEARQATLISSAGEMTKLQCYRPAVLVFETPDATTFVQADLEYSGKGEAAAAVLETADRIVLSLRMPP